MAGGQVERALSVTASDEITQDEKNRLLMLRLGGGAGMGLAMSLPRLCPSASPGLAWPT